MKNFGFSTLRTLSRNQTGGAAAMFALTLGALTMVMGYGIDIARHSMVRTAAQQALDGAAQSAAMSIGRMDVAAEANNFFAANFKTGMMGSRFDPISATTSNGGNTINLTLHGQVSNSFSQMLGNGAATDINLTTSITRNASGVDLALIMDTSAEMNKSVSGGSSTRLQAMKDASNGLIDALFGPTFYAGGSSVSLISYSDAVKVKPSVGNNWLRQPYSSVSNFDGCMANRRNSYDLTAQPPSGSADKKFPRYAGPFDVDDVVQIKARTFDSRVGLPVAQRYVERSIGYTMTPNETGFVVTLKDPENQYYNGNVPLTIFYSHRNMGRFSAELDYIYTDPLGNPINASEEIEIGTRSLSNGAPMDYAGNIFNLVITMMFEGEGELGQWKAYNAAGSSVGTGTFRGAPAGATFGLSSINLTAPFSKIVISAMDNGNRSGKNCYAASWPNGAQVNPGQCILDNTDFAMTSFNLKPQCNLQESLFFNANKTDLQNKINSLTAAGPTRNNIGLAWGWYALDPLWRGVLVPSDSTNPKDYNPNTAKIAVLLTQGKNLDPAQDDAAFLGICSAMKAKGITLYTVSFDVSDAQVRDNLSRCATDANHYYNATNPAQLIASFKQIGDLIAGWQISQ